MFKTWYAARKTNERKLASSSQVLSHEPWLTTDELASCLPKEAVQRISSLAFRPGFLWSDCMEAFTEIGGGIQDTLRIGIAERQTTPSSLFGGRRGQTGLQFSAVKNDVINQAMNWPLD